MRRDSSVTGLKRAVKTGLTALGKRSGAFRRAYRSVLYRRRTRLYERESLQARTNEHMIVFAAYQGRSYACSPKAIYQHMRADPRYSHFKFVWALREPDAYAGRVEFDDAEIVLYGSREFYRCLAHAKYWVTNSRLPDFVQPRADQVYVQTWHGTPFKRIGHDIPLGRNALHSPEELRSLYTRVGELASLFVSPSPFATARFTSAFELDRLGREHILIETGYPRNDFLHTFTEADVERIRRKHGIPSNKKVVLYAPTWRDDAHISGIGYTYDPHIDFSEMRRRLGNEYVILFRAHYFIANRFDFAALGGFVLDVSGVDDINELYAVSDVLVTDYSSVFFDFANLARPIVFYMYDVDTYGNELRGFYLGLDELPGPVVRTEDQLIESLMTAGETPSAELTLRYERFRATFVPLDDGQASRRLVDRMMVEGERLSREMRGPGDVR